ncbi:hypothetical protein BU17DRAFT_80540 [Hysterangium stoloniferum]|nr:hypothetical protein BU17DRAFT_80540 [Hysterangium stoloniferum]
MSTLRTSPSPPSPAPGSGAGNTTNSNTQNQNKAAARSSMGPQPRSGNANSPSLALPSPRPGGMSSGGGRPTSELLTGGGGAGMFQTPEAEAIDQWFENLQNYEVTLEEMAAASLDVNFKEELSAIEQWFRVLSEAERTAALYSLLQQSTQVQIRFFITVLQQMARSDPMTALLSPAAGGSMQSQMEAKLATLGIKSPGLSGSFPPPSPSARNFGRHSIAPDSPAFLSPDAANNSNTGANDPAATLAQQRARLQNKANAAHRISAPALANSSAANVWAAASAGQLGQVVEQEQQQSSSSLQPPPSAGGVGGTRPKSMDLSSLSNLRSPRLSNPPSTATEDGNDASLSPDMGANWASLVNTPAVPMFGEKDNRAQQNLDAATIQLFNSTGSGAAGGAGGNRFVLEDPKSFRRTSRPAPGGPAKGDGVNNNKNAGVYGDDGNLIQPGQMQPGLHRGNRNISGTSQGGNNNNNNNGGFGWNGARSPGLSSTRFGDSIPDAATLNALNSFGLGSPGLMNMNMMGMPGFNMNMNFLANMNALAAAGLTPEAQAQMFAAQMAALGGQSGMMPGFGGMGGGFRSPGVSRHGSGGGGGGGGGGSVRSQTDRRSARGGSGDKVDEEIDPALLEDVPAWLRSLRLHKYTPNFEKMTWRQMVVMNEQQLEEKGVAALGARRKMLKTFEQVRAKMGIPEPAE